MTSAARVAETQARRSGRWGGRAEEEQLYGRSKCFAPVPGYPRGRMLPEGQRSPLGSRSLCVTS